MVDGAARGCNSGSARCAPAGDAKLAELVAQYPGGVENLDGAFAFGTLDDAVQKSRVDRSGSGVVFLEPARRKRNQSVNPIDDVAYARAARDHDDTRGFVQRRAGKAQQLAQIDYRQNHAVQIGEPNKALWRERHAGQVRHPDDFTDVAELKSELAARQIKHNEIRRMTRVVLGRIVLDGVASIRYNRPTRWQRLLGQRAGCV